MKTKYILAIAAGAVIGLTVGCGKKESTPATVDDGGTAAPTTPATVEQQLANPEVFKRGIERARSLIGQKDYAQARQTLQQFDNVKLTPEQQSVLASLKAQIPKN